MTNKQLLKQTLLDKLKECYENDDMEWLEWLINEDTYGNDNETLGEQVLNLLMDHDCKFSDLVKLFKEVQNEN